MIIWLTIEQGMLFNSLKIFFFELIILVQSNCQNETSEAAFVYRRV